MTIGRLLSVAATEQRTLGLRWDDGRNASVDLGAIIAAHRNLTPLRDHVAFGSAQLSSDGWSVEWPGLDIDFGALQLRRWADEQVGEAMPLEALTAWLQCHALTPAAGAQALGVERDQFDRYLSGEVAIPKTVMLAIAGLDGKRAA